VRGQWALVIRRAAAVERAIMHLRGEGIKAPLRAHHWNDVLVRQQQHGALGAVTLEARHDAGAARDRFENLVGNALALEDGEVGGNLRLVTGRVLGVHLNQIAEERASSTDGQVCLCFFK
jgi:hypothetical protein